MAIDSTCNVASLALDHMWVSVGLASPQAMPKPLIQTLGPDEFDTPSAADQMFLPRIFPSYLEVYLMPCFMIFITNVVMTGVFLEVPVYEFM